MIKRIVNIFKLRGEERVPAFVAFVYFALLNAVNVCAYWTEFGAVGCNYHKLFVSKYIVSGFDPLTYQVISEWFPAYNIYRHPLLAFFMYPFYLVNKVLIGMTGVNCATIITAAIIVSCATYSFVFLYRIFRNVIGIERCGVYALLALYFSFGFITLSCMVPDHFVMSQFCLLLVLWLSGEKLKRTSALNMCQTIVLFVLTAGVSLNNGLKVFLATLMTRRKRFFRPGYLALAVILPSAVIWGIVRWEYSVWQLPIDKEQTAKKTEKDKQARKQLRQAVADTISIKTDSAINVAAERIRRRRAHEKYVADHKQMWNVNKGKPISKKEFFNWTDITTSRADVAIHCLFGEAIQLHKDYPLGDVLKNRPLIVKYSGAWQYVNYTVEALIVLLFVGGVWAGRRSRFLWTAMSFFLTDMLLHMGLGFGINEVFIMSAHYLYMIPIAMAFPLMKHKDSVLFSCAFVSAVVILALWCFVWNLTIIGNYFSALSQ